MTGQAHVLVVNDHPEICDSVGEYLAHDCIAVALAKTGDMRALGRASPTSSPPA